jgi:transposase-like protein
VEISELCRREGIHPTQFYGWKKQLLGAASKVFDLQGSTFSSRSRGK